MRARVVALGGLALALGVSVACTDLFHDTDFVSACDLDAAACEAFDASPVLDSTPSPGDSGSDGPTDFCAWSPQEAAGYAQHACAWLGACAGAFGDNALGPCLLHAVLAYDCHANPNRPLVVGSAAHAYWDCLAKAATCGDVGRCVEPSGTHAGCEDVEAGYVACNPNAGTLISCAAGVPNLSAPSAVESCVALGQTCAPSGTAACSGSTTCTGAGVSCANGALHDCDDDGGPLDYGMDCASVGAGKCASNGAACEAVASDGGTCDPTADVTCNGSTASGCPSGVPEVIDCNALLQTTGTTACNASAPGRAWDVSRACNAGTCAAGKTESCSGGTISACLRNATLTISCAQQGLTSCTVESYAGDPSPHAHCTTN